MFAYRLGAKLGVADVTLFDNLTEEQWMDWQATAVIDGWHNGWLHTAQLMAHITNETNRQILIQVEPNRQRAASNKMEWPTGYDLAEKLQQFGKKKRTGMTPEEAEAFLKARG